MEMFVVFIAVNLMAVSLASVLGDLSIGWPCRVQKRITKMKGELQWRWSMSKRKTAERSRWNPTNRSKSTSRHTAKRIPWRPWTEFTGLTPSMRQTGNRASPQNWRLRSRLGRSRKPRLRPFWSNRNRSLHKRGMRNSSPVSFFFMFGTKYASCKDRAIRLMQKPIHLTRWCEKIMQKSFLIRPCGTLTKFAPLFQRDSHDNQSTQTFDSDRKYAHYSSTPTSTSPTTAPTASPGSATTPPLSSTRWDGQIRCSTRGPS